jgi:hypothetical protein
MLAMLVFNVFMSLKGHRFTKQAVKSAFSANSNLIAQILEDAASMFAKTPPPASAAVEETTPPAAMGHTFEVKP